MVYTTLFLIGLLGLIAQALLGAGHIQGGLHQGHATGPVHISHGPAAAHGHATHNAAAGIHRETSGFRPNQILLTILSPLTIFSTCLGAGATGLLMKHVHWHSYEIGLAAAAGGVVFYLLLVRPVWSTIFRFASKPSEALAGARAQTAEAVSRFDASGRGVVRLTVDGQIVRVLAMLEADDVGHTPVEPGDRLTVTSVDGRTNSCRVTRL